MAQPSQGFLTADQLIRALDTQDTAKIGSTLVQLRRLCSIKPLPTVVLDYIEVEPAADSILNLLDVAREANSIHLLANALYTLSYLISSSFSSPFDTRRTLDASRVINHLIQKHSKSIHRCFAPGRTEATLACLSLLTSCASWNDGACAKAVISELRWDHKTVNRLLQTRQGLTAPNAPTPSNPTPASKSSKLKGQLHKADIRTLMLRFIFSVLSNTELRSSIKQELWKMKGLAQGVLKGLQSDSYETVAFVLGNLWDIVTKQNINNHHRNPFTLHLESEIFDPHTMSVMVQLLDRNDSAKDVHTSNPSPQETVAHMVERFLTNLTLYLANLISTSIFQHHVNSRLSQYRILSNTIKHLSPSKSMSHWRLSLQLLESVPTLCSTFWRTAAPTSEPSPTIAWISSVGFASKVASMPLTLPLDSQPHPPSSDHLNLSAVPNLPKNLLAHCFPTPLNRVWFTKALQHQNALVSFSTLTLLFAGLKKARNFCCQLEDAIQRRHTDSPMIASENWSNLLVTFQQSLQAILPDAQVLIAILQTTSRPTNDQKTNALQPHGKLSDDSPSMEPAPQQKDENDGDIVTFFVLAVLLLYHLVVPRTTCNLNFDYTRLISIFFKLNSSNESQTSSLLALHRLQSPAVHLCQSRTLILIGQSALTNILLPSPALLKVLLLLSSFPENIPSDFTHAPLLIKSNAQETLNTLCKSIAPHLRDEHEYQELSIWLSTLSELRTVGEDITPLVIFLEDCIRACLRHPLKYIQISQEHLDNKACASWGSKVGVPMLFSALLSKILAISKGSATAPMNESRVILTSLIIKFSNFYLINLLSASHRIRPILMVHYMSSQLHQILGNYGPSRQGDHEGVKYPDYLGDHIIHILRSASPLSTLDTQKLTHHLQSTPWPSYITQSSFYQHVLALESLHRPFSSAKKQMSSKSKRSVTFMVPAPTPSSINSGRNGLRLIEQQLGYIRFMSRAFEMEKLNTIDPLSYQTKAPLIKHIVNMVSTSCNDDPTLSECFLEEVWNISQWIVKQGDVQLLWDILRLPCISLQKSNRNKIQIISCYADLISDLAALSSKPRMWQDDFPSKNHALIQCTCCLLPLLDADYQSKVLIEILSQIDSIVLSSIDCSSSIMKLLEMSLEIWPQGRTLLLGRLSIEPVIKILCALSCTGNGQVATGILLEITERSLDHEAPSIYSDAMMKTWSTYVTRTLEGITKEERDLCAELRIISCLAQKTQDVASMAIRWLSQASIDELKLKWEGSLSVLVACFETLSTDEVRYKKCLEHLGQSRLDGLIDTAGSCLFSVSTQTRNSMPATEKKIRVLAAKFLNSSCTGAIIDERLTEKITQRDLIPAYSESLGVLQTHGSCHLSTYIDRCLRWLVRRFAEDESTNDDTKELVCSFQEFLDQQSVDYTLSAHLVNPVLSAALDRCLHCPCVMKLVHSVIRHTQLKEIEVLKHVCATVESRHFRALMRSGDVAQQGQDTLLMSVINQLVISCPVVASQAKLSRTLIAFYGGTVSLKDRLMFQVFRIEDLWSDTPETENVMVSWKPINGSKATAGKNLDFITLLDSNKVEATSVWVLNRYKSDPFPNSPLYYDPSFLLNLILHMIENEETLTISTLYSIARVGLLGLAMCALSSDKKDWRYLGDRCLTKFYKKLKASSHKDASEMLLPMEHFRNLHRANEETGRIERVPSLITLFFARCLSVFCATPESSLHPLLTKFLLQRAVINAKDVPMLYSLLYSSNEKPSEGHTWLIQMLHDGLCRTIDWKIMNHRQTFEILITLVLSSTNPNSQKLRLLLFQLIRKAVSHNQACIKLISKSGLLKVLKLSKPFSIIEWEQVVKILQEITARIPLLHYEICRESVENIIQILDDLVQDENCRGELAINTLLILRSLLVCHSFWRSKTNEDHHNWKESFSISENEILVLKFDQVSQRLSHHHKLNKDQGTTNATTLDTQTTKLINEIRARICYLNQL